MYMQQYNELKYASKCTSYRKNNFFRTKIKKNKNYESFHLKSSNRQCRPILDFSVTLWNSSLGSQRTKFTRVWFFQAPVSASFNKDFQKSIFLSTLYFKNIVYSVYCYLHTLETLLLFGKKQITFIVNKFYVFWKIEKTKIYF